MHSAKKYVLVDPAVYENQQQRPESEMDVEIRSILNSYEPDDIKAARYAQALNKFRNVNRPKEKPSLKNEEILDSISNTVRHKAKRILDGISDIPEMSWNEKGELVYKQSVVPNSDIVKLLTDVLKSKTVERPEGWKEFAQGLGTSNKMDRELISNQSSWNIASGKDHSAAAAAAAAPKPRKARTKSSRAVSGRIARVRKRPLTFGDWEEY